ncbi:MAG: 30S ribosomal protein S11 [Leptospiraceae bacterium]|nr:30S ribosomal protein S11 [Leptospiraceae bacterium]MDW7975196.1 30S ribosomal protein S11 [Leptospiraceae bacterium]
MASKKKEKRNVPSGRIYINATYNNTIVTVTDEQGNVICWASAGQSFKGTRKSTPFAAQVTAKEAMQKAKEFGFREADILVKGPGLGRESAIKAIANEGIKIRMIKDITPIPHNGCRPPKKRRV